MLLLLSFRPSGDRRLISLCLLQTVLVCFIEECGEVAALLLHLG